MSNPLDSGAIDRSGESANDDAGSDEPWPCALLMYSTAVEFLNAQQEQDEQARLYLRGCIHTLWECAGNATEDSFMHDVPSSTGRHHASTTPMPALRRARRCVARAVSGEGGLDQAPGSSSAAADAHAKDHTAPEVCTARAKTAQLPQAARQMLSAARVLAGRLIEWRSPASADLLYRAALAAVPGSADAALSLARSRWRSAWTSAQLAQVEELLRAAVLFADDETPDQDRTQARRFLARFLWQSADAERQREALELLHGMKYRYVLHRAIVSPSARGTRCAGGVSPSGRVFALDGALPPPMLAFMRRAFARDAQFWARHDYGAPRTGYFSYMHALPADVGAPAGGALGALESVLHRIWQVSCGQWPRLKRARFVEWWVHRRPHTAGHPLHFDYVLDAEDQPPRHPIASTVLFVDATCGGPTFVTDQTVAKGEATQGWTVQPRTNRLMAFDGKLLHCVLPGHGPSPTHGAQRLTFMAAFWERSPRAPAFEPKLGDADWAWADPLVAKLSSGAAEGIATGTDALAPREGPVDYVPGVCEHVHRACAGARRNGTSLASRLRPRTKRQRLDTSSDGPVNLLDSDDVFVEFEALGCGLVTAKQGECSWGVDDACNVQSDE